MRFYRTFALSAVGIATAASSQTSQDVATINAEKDRIVAETGRINAEKDRITAEKDRINAEADRDKARITSLGLPSFEGTTALKDGNAGKTEAMMLTADALGGAVKIIKSDLHSGPYLVLAGDESVDFSVAESLALEVKSVSDQLNTAITTRGAPKADLATPVAAISAIAGLLRSETEVSGIDLTASLPNRLLADAVASQINGYQPSAMLRGSQAAASADSLLHSWNTMVGLANQATSVRKEMGDKPKDKERAAQLDQALANYKTLFDRATTANAQGVAPITAAVRLDRLSRVSAKVLRVYAEYSGGTFVSTKNIGTFLGADPMRVSGGVIVSYTVTDPIQGKVELQHIISCRTALTSLRLVQAGAWDRDKQSNDQRCVKVS